MDIVKKLKKHNILNENVYNLEDKIKVGTTLILEFRFKDSLDVTTIYCEEFNLQEKNKAIEKVKKLRNLFGGRISICLYRETLKKLHIPQGRIIN